MSSVDTERSERLRSVDLTSGLDRVALARLAAYMDPIAVRSGDTIIREGETGDALYIIVRGTFAVLAGPDERRLNTIGPGHYVGELALLVDEPRSATIRADTDGEVLRLERAQFVELLGRDAGAAKAVATTLARRLRRRDGAPADEAAAAVAPVGRPRTERHLVTKIVGVFLALALGGAAFSPLVDLAQVRFSLLLLAAIALWVTEPVPNVVVSLGLVASWILSGIAPPFATLTGFASLSWVFVLSVLGVATAVARSGLLLRLGLLFIDRVPARLGWQSAALLATGIALTPLLPSAMARAAITAPLAEAVADAMKVPERSPASATIGLSAWIGSGPFLFLFLNGSPVCLLAWSYMSTRFQTQFTWAQWFISAAPLAAIIAVGTFVATRLLLRGGAVAAPAPAPLRLQRAVLGRPSRRELAIAAIAVLMLVGWIIGPKYLIEPGRVALFAFIAVMVVTGVSDLRNLDWDYLIFFGVALTASNLAEGLRLGKILGDSAAVYMAQVGIGGAAFVILAGVLTIIVKSFLAADQAILLLGLGLIPVAESVQVNPWLAVIAILSLGVSWHVPSQSPEYLVAYGATHGRLYSHVQARKMAFAYEGIALAGLALSLPYWHVLGYL